jgi:hypothetical protein
MKRLLALLLFLASATPAIAANFSDWAAVIVAGDWHAHSGNPSEVFDNARRDLGKAFAGIGFNPANMLEFSVRPEKYPGENLRPSEADSVARGVWDITRQAKGGCLIYFTSHGSPDGIVVDQRLLAPDVMATLVSNSCGARPTVVILSACYSGVFARPLAAPNRMILTAARPDRSSFGCGEQDTYTFFDTCILSQLPLSASFPDLGEKAKACVAAREKAMGYGPPSEPQLSVGKDIAQALNWR